MLKEELAARFGVEVALSLSLSLLTTPPSALKVQSFSARCKFLWALFFSCIYEALQGVASSRSPPHPCAPLRPFRYGCGYHIPLLARADYL